VSTDPVALLKTLFDGGWLSANTDGVTPSFHSADTVEEQRAFSPGYDVVKLYKRRPRRRERLDGRYDFAKWEAYVSVHGTTAGKGASTPAQHAEKLMSEIERIVNLNKNNPDSYWQFMHVSDFDQPEEFRSKNKFVMEIILQRWAAVPT
jgi:hypothetical protein